MHPKALDIAGQARMRELISEVSGHHLLLRHWVTERALIIAMRVEARALGPAATGAGEPEEEDESVEEESGRRRRPGKRGALADYSNT